MLRSMALGTFGGHSARGMSTVTSPISSSLAEGFQAGSGRETRIENSTFNDIRGDQHNHYHNHHDGNTDKLKAILDAISNYRKIQQDTLAKATPGTILWLLECEEFKLFVDVDGSLKIMWGSGMPGAGKTILASIVINRLESLAKASRGKICVGYAYIRYSDQAQVTVRGILETLVKQTLEKHLDFERCARKVYDEHIRHGTQPTEIELIELLRQFNQQTRVTFYILDALDEAPAGIRLKLIQTLSSLGARLFITSRPLPALESKLPDAFTFNISAQDSDLDLHIKEKIAGSEYLQDLLKRGNLSLRAHLITMVKAKCDGMFLHASLQLDALQGCFTVHKAIQILESFPRDIEEVYRQTWARIMDSESNQRSLAKAAFVWVLNAKQSLTIDQLRHALATDPDTYHFKKRRLMPESVLLTACRGLIIIDKETKLVRLVHYTARDPLEDLLRPSIPHAHSLLAAVCTTYLADCGFQNTSSSGLGVWGLGAALKADAFLDYAYDAWAFHTHHSLDADMTLRVVTAFILGCHAFPVTVKTAMWVPDLLKPLHIIAFYNLPLSFAGPCDTRITNNPSERLKKTALHLACESGHHAAAQALLLLPGVLVNLTDSDGMTALIWASRGGQAAIVELLLAHPDIQVNVATSSGWTALIWASRLGHTATVKLLLAHPDIQVNLADVGGWTALICASKSGHTGIAKVLLTHPDIQDNHTNSNGNTVPQ